jgi:phosphoglucosamine mutase
LALDGDADRVLIADETGHIVDGDQLIGLVAQSWARDGALAGGGVVGTVMSNLGLERYIDGLGLKFERTQVGDRYVVEHMRRNGFNVGGEQSGHIVLSDFTTTGDGLIAALQVLAVISESGRAASEILKLFDPVPQVLQNVRYKKGTPLEDNGVQKAIEAGKVRLGASGRLVIRKSGTEPLIRVMGECDDEAVVKSVVGEIVSVLEDATR